MPSFLEARSSQKEILAIKARSESQRSRICQKKFPRLLPKVILQRPKLIRLELHQRIPLAPHRPPWQRRRRRPPFRRSPARAIIRIQIIRKIQKVRHRPLRSEIVFDAVKHLQDIAPVQRPQDRRAAIVRREVRVRAHLGRDGRGDVQHGAARERENGVAEECCDALELRVEVVVGAGAEGRAGGGVVGVEADEGVEVCGWVGEVELAQVVGELLRGADVAGEDAEERAFVFLVA